MMKTHSLPDSIEVLYDDPLDKDHRKIWLTNEKQWWFFYGRREARELHNDLEVWMNLPGMVVMAENEEDLLLVVDAKTKRCGIVEVDGLKKEAIEWLDETLDQFWSEGTWKESVIHSEK